MNANIAYAALLGRLLQQQPSVSPRGMKIREFLAFQSIIDASNPVITVVGRKISEKFRYAEAAWILSGDNRLSSIGPFAKKIKEFSDDGERFFGAYGPKVVDQLSYVAQKLSQDIDTRQAVMNIWRENPGLTKDVPCTLSLQFLARNGQLNCVATMRSSDAWLGWPYDIFNFSMVTWAVCLHVRKLTATMVKGEVKLNPGVLILTAGSQHLYERDVDNAKGVLENARIEEPKFPITPFSEIESVDDLIHELWAGAHLAAES